MGIFVRVLSWMVVCSVTGVLLDSMGPLEGWLSGASPGDSRKQERQKSVQTGNRQANEEVPLGHNKENERFRKEAKADGDETTNTQPADEEKRSASSKRRMPGNSRQPLSSDVQGAPSPDQPSGSDGKQHAPEKEVIDKPELQRMYEKFCAIYRERFSAPKKGKRYRINCENGRTLEGELIDVGNGHIRVRLDHGPIRIALHALRDEEVPTFFPDRAAQIRALGDLQRTAKNLHKERRRASAKRAEKDANTRAENDDATRIASMDSSSSEPVGKNTADESSPDTGRIPSLPEKEPRTDSTPSDGEEADRVSFTFDPTPAETPQALRPVLKAFAQWLEMQQRRVGGAIAEKAYAKKHGGGQVVAYLVTSSIFRKQDYELQFQMAEGMWKFWGFRCQAKEVVSHPRHAYLVLLDDKHNIIGGSKPEQANNVWVRKNEKPVD